MYVYTYTHIMCIYIYIYVYMCAANRYVSIGVVLLMLPTLPKQCVDRVMSVVIRLKKGQPIKENNDNCASRGADRCMQAAPFWSIFIRGPPTAD